MDEQPICDDCLYTPNGQSVPTTLTNDTTCSWCGLTTNNTYPNVPLAPLSQYAYQQ